MGRVLERIKENHREFMAMGHIRFAFQTALVISGILAVATLILGAMSLR